MPFAIVGLGGNSGNPLMTLKAALKELGGVGAFLKASKIYRTNPISPIHQPKYLNAVASFQTDLMPEKLFLELERIERKLGKVPKAKEAQRPIDLDLLFYGEKAFKTDKIIVPHPRWKERLFVLIPLSDLLQEIKVAGETWNIKNLINCFPVEEVEEICNESCAY